MSVALIIQRKGLSKPNLYLRLFRKPVSGMTSTDMALLARVCLGILIARASSHVEQ